MSRRRIEIDLARSAYRHRVAAKQTHPAGNSRISSQMRSSASCPMPDTVLHRDWSPEMNPDSISTSDQPQSTSRFDVNFITIAVECTCGEVIHVSGMWPDIVHMVTCACGSRWSVDIGVKAC